MGWSCPCHLNNLGAGLNVYYIDREETRRDETNWNEWKGKGKGKGKGRGREWNGMDILSHEIREETN